MRSYLVHLLSTLVIILTAAVAINWLADPYEIFGTPLLKGINDAKPAIVNNSRIFKMAGYAHRKMDALILGTSRSDAGLSPKHQGFKNQYTLNLATPGQSNAETRLIFQFVADRTALQTAVVGLDFFASNALLPYTDDFSLENFAVDRKWKLLFSFDTLMASKKNLFRSGYAGIKPDEARINYPQKFDKQKFIESEKGYMWGGNYLPGPKYKYLFEADKADKGTLQHRTPLEDIRSMIATAHRRQIKLYLFISPSHARQWEVLKVIGLWDLWEEWKRRLVRINAEEAARARRPPFPFWDFSGYNSITTEALPNAQDENATMFGYIESSHYKPIIGDLILDRMFGLKIPERPLPEDFGVFLTDSNIDNHLHDIRLAREQYRQTYPNDVAEIEALSLEVKKNIPDLRKDLDKI